MASSFLDLTWTKKRSPKVPKDMWRRLWAEIRTRSLQDDSRDLDMCRVIVATCPERCLAS